MSSTDVAGDRRSPARGRRTNRLDAVFARGRPALICYVPLGDPEAPAGLAELYVESGVDVLEIGVPGADPALDGPIVASSLARAVAAGTTAASAVEVIAGWRAALPAAAMVWMTYPASEAGVLVDLVVASGADGLLLPRPAARFPLLARQLERRGVHLLQLLPHDPTLRQVERVARNGAGYVMLQASPGVTGTAPALLPDSSRTLRALRTLGVTRPIALGIGISTPEHARAAIAMGADGVVVGSATVQAARAGPAELRGFLGSLRRALDGG